MFKSTDWLKKGVLQETNGSDIGCKCVFFGLDSQALYVLLCYNSLFGKR